MLTEEALALLELMSTRNFLSLYDISIILNAGLDAYSGPFFELKQNGFIRQYGGALVDDDPNSPIPEDKKYSITQSGKAHLQKANIQSAARKKDSVRFWVTFSITTLISLAALANSIFQFWLL